MNMQVLALDARGVYSSCFDSGSGILDIQSWKLSRQINWRCPQCDGICGDTELEFGVRHRKQPVLAGKLLQCAGPPLET
jgi:hypothetical protein